LLLREPCPGRRHARPRALAATEGVYAAASQIEKKQPRRPVANTPRSWLAEGTEARLCSPGTYSHFVRISGAISSSFSFRRRWFAAPSTWSIATPSSESGYRALRYRMPTPRSLARPSIIRQRRSERTCGRCDRSISAKLLLGPRAPDRLAPTATKYDSWTGDCTAITRQFAQSSLITEGSTWSRRGNRPPRAISVQSRSTRSTSRRSLCIAYCLPGCSTGSSPRNENECPLYEGWVANLNAALDGPYLPLTPI